MQQQTSQITISGGDVTVNIAEAATSVTGQKVAWVVERGSIA